MHLTNDKMIWIPDDEDWIKWGANHEKIEFQNIMNHHISNWDVALDVGAHVGIWSMRLAELFKTVYAFEPVPKHIECWKQNMLRYTDSRNYPEKTITLETVALGHENGTASMKVPDTTNTGMASLVHEIFNQRTGDRWVQPGWDDFPEIEVETRTLDSYEFEKIDFIKMDVEWFELRVLQGAENTIRKHKPVMYIEMHDSEAYTFMKDLDMGYRTVYAHGADRLWNIDKTSEIKQQVKKIDNLKKLLKKGNEDQNPINFFDNGTSKKKENFECLLSLSEKSGITINDMIRFGISLMRNENIQNYDLDDQLFLTTSQYLTFFSLNLPYAFANEKWPDDPAQFITPITSNLFDAKLTKCEVENIIDNFEQKIEKDIPVQYITNEAFYLNRNKFYIEESVNIPYAYFGGIFEKFLAEQEWKNFRVLDMCTGSGCIGISLALLMPSLKVDLVDICTDALSVAQKNVDIYDLGESVKCIHSDLFSEVKNKYDMIITNPPWFGDNQISQAFSSAAVFQPDTALRSGKDGMYHINKILSVANEYLEHDNASLIMTEIPATQANLIKQQYSNNIFEEFLPVNYDGSESKVYLPRSVKLERPYCFRIRKNYLKNEK